MSNEKLAQFEEILEYLRHDGYLPFGLEGDREGWTTSETVIRALRKLAAHSAQGVGDGWMRDPAKVEELAKELESRGWQSDSRGDPECADQASAMAAEVIRRVLQPMLAAKETP